MKTNKCPVSIDIKQMSTTKQCNSTWVDAKIVLKAGRKHDFRVIEYYHKVMEDDDNIKFVVYNEYEDLLTNINENNYQQVRVYIDDKYEHRESIKLRRILKDKFHSGE